MKEFDAKHAAAHGYSRQDWDAVDSPDLTEHELAQARPFATAMPDMAEKMRKAIGRPRSVNPKVAVSLRIDSDILERFKATGPGWQGRMNDALRNAVTP